MKSHSLAMILIMWFLLSLGLSVPMALPNVNDLSEDTAPEYENTYDGRAMLDEEIPPNVQLDMMHFAPSASFENGIYYVCRRGISTVAYFGVSEVYYCVGDILLKLEFPGSRPVIPVGEESTGSVTNYLFGNNPALWRTGLKDCAMLRYPEIYPGINLEYRLSGGALKYEFVVSPHADPSVIKMRYHDANIVRVEAGRVDVSISGFSFVDSGLLAFQGSMVDEVACAFTALEEGVVGFSVGRYDRSSQMVIDPLLAYSTFLGGSGGDYGLSIAVENGHTYVMGYTTSSNFPTVNAYDPTHNGGDYDCFVTKLAADGQSLVYSTFLGGSGIEYGFSIAVENGHAYVTGYTTSTDFPTFNAYDSTHNDGSDCFVTKLAADGQSLVYSTFLGGFGSESGESIAVENGYAYVTGPTTSTDFPTVNAYDPTHNGGHDCFVTKLAADGQSLVYSTFLGGSGSDFGDGIAVENGYAYVTGPTTSSDFPTVNAYDPTHNGGDYDCFVTKLAADGQSLVYSTFLGGSSGDFGDGIVVENGLAYVTGSTASTNFPTVNAYDPTHNGGDDCFVTKLAADGQSLVYSTFLGGSGNDYGRSIAVDNGLAYVTGGTASTNFPTVNAYDPTHNGGDDCFVTKLAADGQSLVYSTFLGGSTTDRGYGIAVENGYAYVTGYTTSSNFPTVNTYDPTYNNGGGDCFVAVLCEDSDSDGLADWEEEFLYGTNPYKIDTDNDNFLDAYEVAYGSDPLDPMSYPPMPQAWYQAIYEDLDGNATLIQNLISWSNGNATLLQTVIQQLDDNAVLLQQVIAWLDGNHTAIETLFTYVQGNATLLLLTVDAVNANTDQLILLAALVTQNTGLLATLNATHIGDIDQIRAILAMLGATVGDTDYDGLDDLDEIALGTNIRCIDTDCDNLNDAYEVKIGTDPLNDDTDGDGYLDGAEVLAGTDPLDPLDYPGSTGTTTITPPPISMEVLVIAGAVGGVVVIVLLVTLKKRTGTKT